MKQILLRVSVLLVMAILILTPQNLNSCGPFIQGAVFTYPSHPGAPLVWYAEGSPGVVVPTFDRAYLVLAYREFAGYPLSKNEEKDALRFMKRKMSNPWDEMKKQSKPMDVWIAAQSDVFGKTREAMNRQSARRVGDYSTYDNCQADAFRTAAFTLRERAKQFGAASKEIREWLSGQNAVFDNCDSNTGIPMMVADSSPGWLKADRRYQIASANFYSDNFDRAAQQFDGIAQDRSSPWHVIAPYLAARAMVRKGTLKYTDDSERWNRPALQEAMLRLQKIVADPSQKSFHHAAYQLMNFIRFRLEPQKRMRELSRSLMGPSPDWNFYQDMIDYEIGMNHVLGDQPDFWATDHATNESVKAAQKSWKQRQFQALLRSKPNDELIDWIFTFQQSGEVAWSHALARWKESRTVPWLVAAVSKIDVRDAPAEELMKAAEQIRESSPAYQTLAFHRVRLLIQAGEREKARSLMSQILPGLEQKTSQSTINLFLQQRMHLAVDFNDFLSFAARPIVDLSDDSGAGDLDNAYCGMKCKEPFFGSMRQKTREPFFDDQAAMILNTSLPLELMAHTALGDDLPDRLRNDLALATWTRAAMMGRHEVANTLVKVLEKGYPALHSEWAQYGAADSDTARSHAALFLMLRAPGIRPYVNAGLEREDPIHKMDSLRDNWWCADMGLEGPERDAFKRYDSWRQGFDSDKKSAASKAPQPDVSFLAKEQAETGRTEWKRLLAMGSGPDYLTSKALQWAKEDPRDPRIPEALHQAVRATHLGCGSKNTSQLGHKAFALLHSRYPHSEWAERTPYWY